jgi:cell division protease FtsH
VTELLEKETLNKEQVAGIFAALVKKPLRGSWTGSASRVPSELPPVTPPPSTNGSRPALPTGGDTLAPEPGPTPPPSSTAGGPDDNPLPPRPPGPGGAMPPPSMPPGGGPTAGS